MFMVSPGLFVRMVIESAGQGGQPARFPPL